MNLLFLASWYPDNVSSRNGLFIWNHAQAAAAIPNTHVILAAVIPSNEKENIELKEFSIDGLTHWVVTYPVGNGNTFIKAIRYLRAWQRVEKLYLSRIGVPDLVVVNVLWRAGLAALIWKLKYAWRYIIIEHWSGYLSDGEGYNGFWLKLFCRLISQRADLVCGVSPTLVKAMNKHGLGKKFKVLPNVVNTTVYSPDTNVPRTTNLLHVSNLAPEKNFPHVLEVWRAWNKINPDSKLWVAGAFDIHQTKQKYGHIEGVEFLGFLEPERLVTYYRKAMCLLLPSMFETFSLVTAEALACGTPVLSSKLSALSNFDTRAIVALPELNADTWVEALKKLPIYDEHELHHKMNQEYSIKKVSLLMQSIFNK